MSLPTESPPPQHLQFRLLHLFYGMALLGSELGLSGQVFFGPIVFGFWWYVFAGRDSVNRFLNAAAVVVSLLTMSYCLLPPAPYDRSLARRTQCANNLRQIALGLERYYVYHGEYPPAFITDTAGKPLHSWRVLILPYLGEDRIYKAYRFDEPWDGPNNRKLAADMPRVFHCPTDSDSRTTSYLAVVGEHTFLRGGRGRTSAETTNREAVHTIAIVEHQIEVPWMAPTDISIEEFLQSLGNPHDGREPGHLNHDFFYDYCTGRNALFGDGRVRYLRNSSSPGTWRKLLQVDDGEGGVAEIGHFLKNDDEDIRYRTNWPNIVRLGLFMAICAAPILGLFRRPKSPASVAA